MLNRAIAVLLLLPLTAACMQEKPIRSDLETAVSAVVRISGEHGGAPVRGSGFVIAFDGDKATIVTASHVIEGMPQVEVAFAADSTERFVADLADLVGMDAGNPNGLAAFQVRGALPAGVTPLKLEVESRPGIGDALFLLGFLETELAPRTTQRVLASRRGTLLLVDQGIGEGFSGGPVLKFGKVVGVVTETDDQTTYAVNAVVAREALEGWGVRLDGQSTVTNTGPQVDLSLPTEGGCVPGEEITEDDVVFVRICPGTFKMGSVNDGRTAYPNEQPAHEVTLTREFWIGKTEVTNAQYRRFRPDHLGDAMLPVTHVTWEEAKAACETFGGRLPTEAEWEYAARAGEQTMWSFGNARTKLGEYAWFEENSGDQPHPVGSKKPNAWGLHDMHGNVYEWVADWYGPYPRAAQRDPEGPASGKDRVLRGGSFIDSTGLLRSAVRLPAWPLVEIRFAGFRCVRAPRREP